MPLHSGKSPDRTKDGPRFAGRGVRRQRAAGTVSLRATGAQEGALRPLLRITPPPGMFADARDRKQICPHSVEKFVCDNVAADKFRACPRGGGLAMYGLCLLFA